MYKKIVSNQIAEQVLALLKGLDEQVCSGAELMDKVGLKHQPAFTHNYLRHALAQEFIAISVPEKPNSRLQ